MISVHALLIATYVGTTIELFRNTYNGSTAPCGMTYSFTKDWVDTKHYGEWEKVSVIVTGILVHGGGQISSSYSNQKSFSIQFENGTCSIPSK